MALCDCSPDDEQAPHWAVTLYFFIVDAVFSAFTGTLSYAVTQHARLDPSLPFAAHFALLKPHLKASIWLVLPVTLSIVISSLQAPGNLNQAANLGEAGSLMKAYGHVRDLLSMEISFEELKAQGSGTWFWLVQCIGYGLLHPSHAWCASTVLLVGQVGVAELSMRCAGHYDGIQEAEA